MAMNFEQPEDIAGGGGNFVDKPGVYHMLVTDTDENPAKKDGSPLDAVKVSLSCLTGTNPEQKDRSFDLLMWAPEEGGGEMPNKIRSRFALATCLIGHHQPKQKTSVETSDAIGRQLVCKLRWRQKKDDVSGEWKDTDRLELSFADIWHVDDPEVAKTGIKLDQDSLAMIPAALRKPVTQAVKAGGNGVVTNPAAAVTSTRGGATVDLSSV